MFNKNHALFFPIIFLYFLPITVIYANYQAWIDGTCELIKRAESIISIDDSNGILYAPSQNVPQVGDKRDFYAVDFSHSLKPYFVSATCRAVGKFCYIFVEDTQWQKGSVTNVSVTRLQNAFDNSTPADNAKGIYEIESVNLGSPPDSIDHDPKIYILILDIPDDITDGSFISGYFEPMNQKSGTLRDPNSGILFRSNQVEMIYLDCNPMKIDDVMARDTLAHEFQHLIHWNNDPDEDIWINEGCSEYASQFLCGYGSFHNSSHVEAFEKNPQISLVNWDNLLANYGATYLWMLFLHEHYGGVATIANLISNQSNSISGVNAVLTSQGYSERFEDVFSSWKIANYIDDEDFYFGKYSYKNVDIEVNINNIVLPVANSSRTIKGFSADYINLRKENNSSGLNINISPRRFSDIFDVKAISMMNGIPVSVESVKITSGEGNIKIPLFGYGIDDVLLIVSWFPKSEANFRDTSIYVYSADSINEVNFAISILPNAVNSGYIEIIAKMIGNNTIDSMKDIAPKISIINKNKTIIDEKPMNVAKISGKSIYSYQLYIPSGLNSGDIRYEITYGGQLVGNGSINP